MRPHLPFTVSSDAPSITVERTFRVTPAMVWVAWTAPDHLCRWWAPAPYLCHIRSLDLRPGGRWLYCMEGPEGDRHWSFFDFTAVHPLTHFAGNGGFCDEHGQIDTRMPRSFWEVHFNPADDGTRVRIVIQFASRADLERILAMGFREGFSTGLDQLDKILSHP